MRLVEQNENNIQSIGNRNQSSFIINNFNQNEVPYGTLYSEPQNINNSELNYQQKQELLKSQNQLNNKYYQQYQQQYIQFDNDSMLSQNMVVQSPPFSYSQEEECDTYYNPQNFLQNQVKNQQNEEHSSIIHSNNNQIIYYDIEQCKKNQIYETNLTNENNYDYQDNQYNYEINQNYEEPNNIKQENLLDPYSISNIKNNCINYNNSYQNQNISNSQSVSQQQIYPSGCMNCYIINKNFSQNSSINNYQLCSYCSQFQQNSQTSNQFIKQEREQKPYQITCQYDTIRQNPQQFHSNNNQNITIIPQQQQTFSDDIKQSNNEQRTIFNGGVESKCGIQQKLIITQTNVIKKQNLHNITDESVNFKKEFEIKQEQSFQSNINYQYIENNQQKIKITLHQNKINEHINTSENECAENENEGNDNNQQIYDNQNICSNQDDYFNDSSSQISRKNQRVIIKDVNCKLSSKKTIKKYLPKKKYEQSRQKNIFKNFGNALINCIQNNYVIREYITKRFENDSSITKVFYDSFIKDSLHQLKNKEDFLQGWKIQNDIDDQQMILFKQVFKDVSLCFFNEYAAKYVNESEKLKNKDIHIKAIPIFIRGIRNVNELFKFKLS